MEEVDYLGEKIIRWQKGQSTFLAHPKRGARLMNWNISYADGSFRNVIHWPELDNLSDFAKARGGNPILFPFCARTYANGETQNWIDPKGTQRPMLNHGYARQGDFEIDRINDTGFTARFLPTDEAREAYPYDYTFEVIYRFAERKINVELRLANHGNEPIPWSAGHHFYFALPWLENTTRSDYHIDIPAKSAAYPDKNGKLQAIPRFDKKSTLSNPDLADRFHYNLKSNKVTCHCPTDDSHLNLKISSEKHPNTGYTVTTWTETSASPFYCIEPWMGPANSPEHKVGYHEVPPSSTSSFTVEVEI